MLDATDGSLQFRTFANPMFSLMHMAAKNDAATKYLAIGENFVMAAIHVAAMKNIPFARGTLPDLPADMPCFPAGYVLSLLPQCHEIPIQVVVSRMKNPTNTLKSNIMHSFKNVEQKGALRQLPM